MPPQARAAARRVVALDTLPQALVLRFFALLPVDARARAATVCRAWRAMLAEQSLWTRLDFTAASGVRNPTWAMLLAAVARAGGQLQELSVFFKGEETYEQLLPLLAANAATMRELRIVDDSSGRLLASALRPAVVAALLRAAPGLRLTTGVRCSRADALPVLRMEPPFERLRLHIAIFERVAVGGWAALADCLAGHSSLQGVRVSGTWPQLQVDRVTPWLAHCCHCRCFKGSAAGRRLRLCWLAC